MGCPFCGANIVQCVGCEHYRCSNAQCPTRGSTFSGQQWANIAENIKSKSFLDKIVSLWFAAGITLKEKTYDDQEKIKWLATWHDSAMKALTKKNQGE